MSGQDRGDLCRLLVVGPASQVDVSLPTHIPLADMMPAVLGSLGSDLADRGLEHSGWIAQRLGGPALDDARTVAELELLDGESVYVRPRTDQIPPLAYDDLIDGISAGLRNRAWLWRPKTTRLAGLVLFAVWVGVALTVAGIWPDVPRRTTALAAAAVLCFVAGFVVARTFVDRALAAILGAATVGAVMLAALDVMGQWFPPGTGTGSMLPRLILASASSGAAVGVLVAAFVFPRTGWRQTTAGLASLWLLILVATGLWTRTVLTPTAIAAILACLTTVLRPMVPTLAFKLAGFSLPDMPAEPTDLQQGIEPLGAAEVLSGATVADQFMTAIYLALGLVSGGAMLWLALAHGSLAPLVAWLVATAQLLVIRSMTSTWHRLALGVPALVTLAAWCVDAPTHRGSSAARLAVCLCLITAVVCGMAARVLAGRKVNPIWGRLGDLAHTLALAALGPAVAALLGLLDLIRSRVG